MVALIIAGCAKTSVSDSRGTATTGVVVNASDLGLSKYPDLPLDSVPSEPINVKFLAEHRTALDGKTITVKGVVVRAILGEEACPVCKTEPCPGAPCMRPRIFLADSSDENRDKNYDLIILVGDKDAYKVGQTVEINGIVEASKIEVMMIKVGETVKINRTYTTCKVGQLCF